MAAIKTLTISQVEQAKDSSVWVMNTSGSKDGSVAKGIVNITIVEGNGRAAVIRIPVTFIPVDLTTQATKAAMMMSPDFRRLVAAGFISLLSEEDALAMTNNDKARDEQRRLMNIDQVHEVQVTQQSPAVTSIMSEAAGNIGGLAMNLAHTSDGDEDTLVTNLRNNLDTLTQNELQYVVNNSTFHKVKMLAAEHIVR